MPQRRRVKKQNRRAGVAATEFAFVIPILLILTFGTVEICSVIFLKEKVTIAAHEGARVAIKKMSSEDDAISAVEYYLESRGIDVSQLGANAIVIDPDPQTAATLDPVSVEITVPVSGNALLPHQFYSWFGGSSVSSEVVMYKEFAFPADE